MFNVPYGPSPSSSELARDDAEVAAERELFGEIDDSGEEYEDAVQEGLERAERDSNASLSTGSAAGSVSSHSSEPFNPWVYRNVRGPPKSGRSKRRGGRVIRDDDEAADTTMTTPMPRQTNPNATPQTNAHCERGQRSDQTDARSGIPVVDARCMDDFNPQHFGEGIQARPPIFRQGTSASSTWQSWDDVDEFTRNIRPLRTECFNVPVEVFARDGTRFRHWSTPNENALRASQIAAILGMAFTPTSKGFLSGSHEELQRANGEADEDEEGDADKKKKISRVFRYAYMMPHDNNVTAPMFVIGYQELYDDTLSEVTAVRIYKFVFDEKHSDSELWRKLMDENRDTFNSAGTAHNQNATRRKNLVAEQKQNRVVTGGLAGLNNLEYYAGTQYSRIVNETVLLEALKSYGGKSMHDDGMPVFDYSELPRGVTTTRMTHSNNGKGGTHPLSPEYMFNARRGKAFSAGLMGFDGNPINVHPDFKDPSKHFSDRGDFTIPEVGRRTGGFYFCIDPSVTNIFDVPLPRSIYGAVCAGKELLNLFRDENPDLHGVNGESNASLSDCFNQMMTAVDKEHVAMARQMTETVIAYDSMDVTEVERRGLCHYGEVESKTNAYIIEPRQILKEIQMQTRRVQAQLIEPWKLKRDKLAGCMNKEIRTSEGEDSCLMNCSHDDDRLSDLHLLEQDTRERHCSVVKDLVHLHINRIEAAFQSKMDRETVPAGYCAMYDGLKEELAKTVNNTASMAFSFDEYLTADDISIFSHVHQWLGNFFEFDCFIEGSKR